ncbi:MAG: hypothetical protein ACLU9S_05450 [Oscillospiraceae bacterium]
MEHRTKTGAPKLVERCASPDLSGRGGHGGHGAGRHRRDGGGLCAACPGAPCHAGDVQAKTARALFTSRPGWAVWSIECSRQPGTEADGSSASGQAYASCRSCFPHGRWGDLPIPLPPACRFRAFRRKYGIKSVR